MKRKKFFLVPLLVLFLCMSFSWIWKLSYQPKVYDCFLFFNEFDVLDIRLHELSDKVDKFILVESTMGFSKKKKPLYFLENKERYAPFLDKIVHVVVDQFPEFPPIKTADYWDVEIFQRNQIMKGLKKCHPNDRDIIMISDVDEIIRGSEIDHIIKLIDQEDHDIVFGDFEFYKFFLNRKVPLEWAISVATSWKNLSKYIRSVQSFRDLSGFAKGHAFNGFYVLESVKRRYPSKKWSFAKINNIGWHFTCLGDFAKFLQKIENYSHLEMDNEHNRQIENIQKEVAAYEWCPITDQFPKYIFTNKDTSRWQPFIDQKQTLFR